MTLDELRCSDCGAEELLAVWPGEAGETTDLFRLTRSISAKSWCEVCWRKRYGHDSAPPRSGGRAKAAP